MVTTESCTQPATTPPDPNKVYNLEPVQAPALQGLALRLFVALSGWWLFQPIRSVLLAKNGVYKVLRDSLVPEAPTFSPLQRDNIPEALAEQQNASAYSNAQVLTTQQRLQACWELTTGCDSDTRFWSIADYHKAYSSGQIDPCEVAAAIIAAIEQHPACAQVFIRHSPQDVMNQAEASRNRYAEGAALGPLDGVPYAVKDNMDATPYTTGDGSTWRASRCKYVGDCKMVARLRACGAILLGKTAMHESGMGTTGLNIRTGTPLNPYSTQEQPRYTGASSSGSAAAVAVGLCPFALGNDGGGSIRIPAASCGVSGIKVTYGRAACPAADGGYSSVTVHGPIASCVRDLALVYSVIANNGAEHAPLPALMLPKLQQLDEPKPFAGQVVGVFWKWFEDAEPAIVSCCKDMLRTLEGAGAVIRDVVIPELAESSLAHTVTIMSETASSLKPYLRDQAVLGEMNPDLLLQMRLCDGYTSSMYCQAQRWRTRAIQYMQNALKDVNFIATPTLPIPAPPASAGALKGGESDLALTKKMMNYVQVVNFTGHPAISIPAGMDSREGMPVGFQLIGRYYQEASLLRAAAILESRTDNLSLPPRHVPAPTQAGQRH